MRIMVRSKTGRGKVEILDTMISLQHHAIDLRLSHPHFLLSLLLVRQRIHHTQQKCRKTNSVFPPVPPQLVDIENDPIPDLPAGPTLKYRWLRHQATDTNKATQIIGLYHGTDTDNVCFKNSLACGFIGLPICLAEA